MDYTDRDVKSISKTLKSLGYSNKLRRYPKDINDVKSKREPQRKWWPPEAKMDPKVKADLNLPF